MRRPLAAALTLVLATCAAPPAAGAQEPTPAPVQQDPPRVPRPAPEDGDAEAQDPVDAVEPVEGARTSALRFRVAGVGGFQAFTARESFETVLGSSSGALVGGSAGVLIGRHAFVDVQVSRFRADGSRVFIADDGTAFDLGIPTSVTVMPIDISAGWRFAGRPRPGRDGRPRLRPVPFAGAGVGVQLYQETSDVADAGDDVDESHGSYHVLGGVELPFTRHLGATVDVLYRWVPGAIGSTGVSAHFDEDDLGGAQVRFKVAYTF